MRTPALEPTAGRSTALPILLCAMATFIDGYDVQALGLTIPLMAKEFGVAPSAFSIAASASLAGMALGALFLSPLADRFGRRRTLVPLLLLFGFATLGAAFSTSTSTLTFWRFVAGLGLGATLPVALTLTAEIAPPHRRNILLSLVVSCTAFGAFAGGFVAPALTAEWGWRGVYGFGAAAPVLIALLCLKGLPAGSINIAKESRRSTSVRELMSPTLRSRTLLLWTLFVLNQFVAYALISWLPTLLHHAGLELAAASRATGLLALGGVIGSLLVTLLADRGRARFGLIGAYVLGATSLAVCGLVTSPTAPWNLLVLFVGCGVYGAQMSLGAMVAAFYPAEVRATGIGWSTGIGRIGSVIGPLVLGLLLSVAQSPTSLLGALMVPVLLCAVGALFLPAIGGSRQ